MALSIGSIARTIILTRGNKSKKSGQLLFLVFVASSVFLTATLFVLSSLSSAKVDTAIDHKYTVSSRDQKTCVFTISAMNNFGFALALYDSVMTNSPSIDCFVWFMGDDPEPKDPDGKKGMAEIKEKISHLKNFKMVTLQDMQESLDGFFPLHLAFKFTLQELQTTIKPFAFQYIFQELKPDSAIYLDNDIWVTGSFEELQDDLAKYSAIVTPHMTSPGPKDELYLENKEFFQGGIYYGGFFAFSKTEASFKFLNFWTDHLALYGFTDAARGMFFDQDWGNFIPAFFERDDYLVLRDHRYNIAYWNLHGRGAGLHMKNGLPHIENPLTKKAKQAIFVHFSLMSSLENDDIKKIKNIPRMENVIRACMERLEVHNATHYRYVPYGFGQFSNGMKITPEFKKTYAGVVRPANFAPTDTIAQPDGKNYSPFLRFWFRQHVDWTNPFCVSKKCLTDPTKQTFLSWYISYTPGSIVDFEGLAFFSPLERNIWNSRPDLQAAFPDPLGSNHDAFKLWFESSTLREKVVEKGMFKLWKDTWKYHKDNSSKFHKQVQSIDDIGVNVFGWHCGLFSIGAVAIKLYDSLKQTDLTVSAVEAPSVTAKTFVSPTEFGIDLTRSLKNPVNLVVMNAPETGPYFTTPIPESIRSIKYNIGYWNWELDKYPADWMTFQDAYDEIWVPTQFNKLSIESTPGFDGTIVRVVPITQRTADDHKSQGSDFEETFSKLPLEVRRNLRSSKSKPFVFLLVFDFFSYTERKNPTASIRSFIDAFPLSKDKYGAKYQLIVKTHSGTEKQMDELRKFAKKDPRVIFINSVFSDEENKALHEYQDCHISLHRSEGYGMNILESMASGVPVIATNYSGNSIFFEDMPNLENKCAFPVSYKLVEIKKSIGPYLKGNHWAEPDHNSAVQAMREASKNECRKSGLGRDMIKQVNDHYGPEAIGERMKTLLIEALPRIKKKTKIH